MTNTHELLVENARIRAEVAFVIGYLTGCIMAKDCTERDAEFCRERLAAAVFSPAPAKKALTTKP